MKWLPWLICIILLLAMYHEGCETGESTTRSDTIVTYDTVDRLVPTKPKPYKVIQHDTIPADVDTQAILAAYYTATEWRDSIVTDTLSIAITDTLSRNAIQGRSVKYTLRLPTKTITHTITKTKHVSGLYVMPYATPVGPKQGVGLGAIYANHDWLVQAGYGTSGLHIGAGVRVFKTKRR